MKAKKGLLVREGAGLDTPEVTTLDNGLRITCVEEKTVDGKVRLRLTQPVCGWASKKLLDFECGLGKRPTGATPWLRKVAAPEKATKRLVLFNWTGNRGGYGSSHNFKEWPKGLAGFEVDDPRAEGLPGRVELGLGLGLGLGLELPSGTGRKPAPRQVGPGRTGGPRAWHGSRP